MDLKSIYTDGGCKSTAGVGSWAYIIFDGADVSGNPRVVKTGSLIDTTNNRAEMLAAIRAIESLPQGTRIRLYSDSGYLVNGVNHPSYLKKWIENDWITSRGEPVKNQDLWKRILGLIELYDIRWTKVRGHGRNDDPLHNRNNELCDRLCTMAMQIRLNKMEE